MPARIRLARSSPRVRLVSASYLGGYLTNPSGT